VTESSIEEVPTWKVSFKLPAMPLYFKLQVFRMVWNWYEVNFQK